MRKVLEDLIFVGVVKETYKIFGKEWTLKSLTSDEQLQATSSTGDYDNVSRISALKIALVARALCEIDGVQLDDVSEKITFLGKMQQPVVDMLYNKYTDLQSKQNDALKEMSVDIKN